MPQPLRYILMTSSVSVMTPDGRTHNITAAHINYDKIREALRRHAAATGATPHDAGVRQAITDDVVSLLDVKRQIEQFVGDRIRIENGVVFFLGAPMRTGMTEAILRHMREGYDAQPLIRCLDKLMDNPSRHVVQEFYSFVEAGHFSIAEDGDFLAYKRVRHDFLDMWSGHFDNSPGRVVEMRRNEVDENPANDCGPGFHYCSMGYLPSYGANRSANNRVVIVKINPRDIVSIPDNYQCLKGRCCRYEVVSEVSDAVDLLKMKPVYTHAELGGAPRAAESDQPQQAHTQLWSGANPPSGSPETEDRPGTSAKDYQEGFDDGQKEGTRDGKSDAEERAECEPIPEGYEGDVESLVDYDRGYRIGYTDAYVKAYAAAGGDTSCLGQDLVVETGEPATPPAPTSGNGDKPATLFYRGEHGAFTKVTEEKPAPEGAQLYVNTGKGFAKIVPNGNGT